MSELPLLAAFGVNLASAATSAMAAGLYREVSKRRKSVSVEMCRAVNLRLGCEIAEKTMRRVVFDVDVWAVLVQEEPSSDELRALLHPLRQPNDGLDDRRLAQALRQSLAIVADHEIRVVLKTWETLARIETGQQQDSKALSQMAESSEQLFASQSEALELLREIRAALSSLQPDAAEGSESQQFAPSVVARYREINQRVEQLTKSQFDVITALRGKRRVTIFGTPGSGKTLVAVEKAIRLANAGLTALLVCHNPYLAEHLRKLTSGTGVEVSTLAHLVRGGQYRSSGSVSNWSHYVEPTTDELNAAFDRFIEAGPSFDAILVDEAQDFRDEWWLLLEALSGPAGILYLFADGSQTLVQGRFAPMSIHSLDLTMNCRNSGRVYSFMRAVTATLPSHDRLLASLGTLRIIQFDHEEHLGAVRTVAAQLGDPSRWGDVAVVVDSWSSPSLSFRTPVVEWRFALKLAVGLLARGKRPLLQPGSYERFKQAIEETFQAEALAPSPSAIRFVTDFIQTEVDIKNLSDQDFGSLPHWRSTSRWGWSGRISSLSWDTSYRERGLIADGSTSRSELLEYMRSGKWADEIPDISTFAFVRPGDESGTTDRSVETPVFTVEQVKGLEFDYVLAIWDGFGTLNPTELLVAVSRARVNAVVMLSTQSVSALPPRTRHFVEERIEPIGKYVMKGLFDRPPE